MDVVVRVNSQTVGRDKIARLLQYLSRFLWHNIYKNNKNSVNALKNLEFQLSTFRKLLRFGRCVDVLYSTLPLFKHEDSTQRYTIILSKISNSLFLLMDHFLWLGRANVYPVDLNKWGLLSNKYWLYSITMNLVRDFYEIANILKRNKNNIFHDVRIKNLDDICKALTMSLYILARHKDVMIDTIKNGCDFFIPLTNLQYVKLSPGTIGLLGVISSLAGLLVVANPVLKLPYA